jgi:hypothetical protein
MTSVIKRMTELMSPVEQQLLMCDNREDQLMMACAMLQRVNEIFTFHLGEDGARRMIRGKENES